MEFPWKLFIDNLLQFIIGLLSEGHGVILAANVNENAMHGKFDKEPNQTGLTDVQKSRNGFIH